MHTTSSSTGAKSGNERFPVQKTMHLSNTWMLLFHSVYKSFGVPERGSCSIGANTCTVLPLQSSLFKDTTRKISFPVVLSGKVFSDGVSVYKVHICHKLCMSTDIRRFELKCRFPTDAQLFQNLLNVGRYVFNTSANCIFLERDLGFHSVLSDKFSNLVASFESFLTHLGGFPQ